MAVGLLESETLAPIAGIRLGTVAAGIRRQNRRDLVTLVCEPGTVAAGVFTQNQFAAAPVLVAREHLARVSPRALVINTGYANAGTGSAGYEDARRVCVALAAQLGCDPQEVLPFSTGVIGERLPVDRIVAALPRCVDMLAEDGWTEAARGIMTTDTIAKGTSRRVEIEGAVITVTGIAKGAGMIHPNMATMLAFVATDARVSGEALHACVRAAADASFNRITIDGDTSTNDACLLLATGRAGPVIDVPQGSAYRALANAVREVCVELAQAIVRDAEGVTKFITLEIVNGDSEAECLAVGRTIGTSPLVKTAFFASDPNWGRILAAIGRAPVGPLDPDRVTIDINDVRVFERGAVSAHYREEQGAAAMRASEVVVRIDLARGSATATVWTSDLSHDYVRINAEYRS